MLTKEQKDRFSRQLLIPEFGETGQKALLETSVLIAGLGGLGSVSAYYLVAAGIGHLKIIDRDYVAIENLNRQILHNTNDLGRPKIESARDKLRSLNPDCIIEPIHTDIRGKGLLDLVEGCRLIIDATDNLDARLALNRASVEKRIPFIYGGIDGLSGMTTTFIPGKTACLACIFPSQGRNRKDVIIGALGPVVGTIASIQCTEAVMILSGKSPKLAGRMLRFNGMEIDFKETKITRNPRCHVCGSKD